MRRSAALLFATALFVTACTGSPNEKTADDLIEADTAAAGAAELPAGDEGPGTEPAADVPSAADEPAPGHSATGSDDADAADAPVDAPTADPAEAQDDAAGTIPARFRGEWNAERSACGTGRSETRLRISADRLQFYESAGVVDEVDVESDRVITVAATYQGEGDTWQEERRLVLSEDGSSLTVSSQGAALVRYRCP